MADNLNKRPQKGILKTSKSFERKDTPSTSSKKPKGAQFDEMNIIATLHPPDKEYGHIKIDEPKTPYNYMETDTIDELDAVMLSKKLEAGFNRPPRAFTPTDECDEIDETEEEKELRKVFESKRKEHYNEFHAVRFARKLLEEDEEEDEVDEDRDEEIRSAKLSSGSMLCPEINDERVEIIGDGKNIGASPTSTNDVNTPINNIQREMMTKHETLPMCHETCAPEPSYRKSSGV